jgi:hypothetical protein
VLLYGLLDIVLFSSVPMNLLLVWGSLLAIPPLKSIWLVACGLLLPTRCLKMAFLPTKETYFGTPTTSSTMAFPLATMTNKGCLVLCIFLLLVLVYLLATSSKYLHFDTFLIISLFQFSIRRMEWECASLFLHYFTFFK